MVSDKYKITCILDWKLLKVLDVHAYLKCYKFHMIYEDSNVAHLFFISNTRLRIWFSNKYRKWTCRHHAIEGIAALKPS